jgi:hypothetical protein
MCKYDDCNFEVLARGICSKHYNQERRSVVRNGEVWVEDDRDGFWEFVKKELNIVCA